MMITDASLCNVSKVSALHYPKTQHCALTHPHLFSINIDYLKCVNRKLPLLAVTCRNWNDYLLYWCLCFNLLNSDVTSVT